MELYPAVDILGGKTVRLVQGDFDRSSHYDDQPLEAARRWLEQGALRLHVVDLDGARSGAPASLDHLAQIRDEFGERLELLQYGGGLRSADDALRAIATGADRVVIGTAAFRDPAVLDELLSGERARIAVGVDVRDGRIAVHGWQERTDMLAADAVQSLARRGVETIVYTDVDRDGTLEGVDAEALRILSAAAGESRLVCSGGVGSLADLSTMAALDLPNLEGVIVGKALYEGRFSVAQALAELGR